MATEINVRPATIDDLETIVQLKVVGFGGNNVDRLESLKNNPRYNYRHIVLGEVNGKVVGTATAFPTQMWLTGVPLQMGAVAGVTTLPEYRNQGVAFAMMDYLLKSMYRQDMAISILFPAVHDLYYRCGYANCTTWHSYGIKPDNLPKFEEAANVRPFQPEDLRPIQSIYRGGQLSLADGRLTRSSAWWELVVSEEQRSGDKHIVVYQGDGGVEGYLKYQLGNDRILTVSEMFVSSDAAYRGLWGYMASQPYVTGIDYLAPADDPIYHLLKQPKDRHGGNRGWIFDDIYHTTASVLLRIINLKEALTSRFYPHNMMGNRVIKLSDPQIPDNETPVNFRTVDGRPDIIPVEGQFPDIEADIGTFSQIFCGFLTPEVARRLGRLEANDETVEWLTRAMVAKPLFIPNGDWF